MPLQIVEKDITTMQVDAIVNAANNSLLGGGGVDGCIHRAAGPELLAECRTLGGCKTGEAKITGGYRLPCRYIIHTVGPIWCGGDQREQELLTSCYRNSLELALAHDCETVAFPLISSGIYGYPKDQAMQVAVETIRNFLQDHEMTVYLALFGRGPSRIGRGLYDEIRVYLGNRYVDSDAVMSDRAEASPDLMAAPCEASFAQPTYGKTGVASLQEALAGMEESFSQMLLRKIDEKGMTDVQCYKKANISRKLFSKIRSDALYRPSKATALAFAIALELPLSETKELLEKAGFALSHSNKADIIVEYFIQQHNYDVLVINEALFAFGQALLGG